MYFDHSCCSKLKVSEFWLDGKEIWFDGTDIFVGLSYCNVSVFFLFCCCLLGAAIVLIFIRAVFSIVVSRVLTYVVLLLFSFFSLSILCDRVSHYFMAEKNFFSLYQATSFTIIDFYKKILIFPFSSTS